VAGVVILIATTGLVQPLRSQARSDVEEGRKLFAGMCVTCHGFEGKGGDAPSLNRPKLGRAPDDAALRALIADGLPERGMPRVRRLTDNEIGELASYVRSLGQTAAVTAPGNVQQGRETYTKLGCQSCHIIKGEGSSLGPELTEIGRLRGPEYLREAVVDPGARLPRGTLPIPARGFSEFLPVVVVTREGREIRGLRINEDSFTIQVRDTANQIYSFRKADLSRIEKQSGTSLMPSFSDRLSKAELDDLIAYLSSLRGAQ
ncbi:MAG TPA: c-type cytochrome, partial [Bryobacteraceae bacterium]|nr:c-type cytochrome [Bryobacteraceae bacterium]